MPSSPSAVRSRRHRTWRTTLLPGLIRGYLALIWRSSRIVVVGLSEVELRRRSPAPYIGAFWHERMLWPAWAFRGPDYAVLVSDHADGELIARAVGGLGTRAVFGSSLRGGTAGLRAAARLVGAGVNVAITPDGPVGPARVAKPGVIALASLTGAPIVPMAYAARPDLVFASWDRFRVPLPFGRAWVALGEPLAVPAGLEGAALEPYRAALESALAALTAEVDRHAGRGGSAVRA